MKLQPLGDRVVLKVLENQEKTKAGIYMPESSKEKPVQAEVIAVGSGEVIDGKKVPLDVEVGNIVIYSKFAGTEVSVDGEDFLIVKQNDILAICK